MNKEIFKKIILILTILIVPSFSLLSHRELPQMADTQKIIARKTFNAETDNQFHQRSIDVFSKMTHEKAIRRYAYILEQNTNALISVEDIFGLNPPNASDKDIITTVFSINTLGNTTKRVSKKQFECIKKIPQEIRQKATSSNHYNGTEVLVNAPYPATSILRQTGYNILAGIVAALGLVKGTEAYLTQSMPSPTNNIKLVIGSGVLFGIATVPKIVANHLEQRSIPHYKKCDLVTCKKVPRDE